MCEPTTIALIGLAVTVAATGTSLYAQSEQQGAENDYQKKLGEARNKQIEANYQLAIDSANQQNRAIQERIVQEGAALSVEEQRAARELRQAVSTARASSAEAGVAGLSVDALMNDFLAQEARYRDSNRQNLEFTRGQLMSEAAGVQQQARGRAQSIQAFIASPVNAPNYAGAALRIGGDSLSTYDRVRYKGPSTRSTTTADQGDF